MKIISDKLHPNIFQGSGCGLRLRGEQQPTEAPQRLPVSQSVSFVAVPPRSLHHRLKGRLRSPRSTQVLPEDFGTSRLPFYYSQAPGKTKRTARRCGVSRRSVAVDRH